MKRIKSLLIGAIMMLLIVVVYNYYNSVNEDREMLEAQTALIEKQVRNVSKLVVTEATYAKVYTYENTSSYGWDFFESKKTALLSSNAQVTVGFDLKKMHFQVVPRLLIFLFCRSKNFLNSCPSFF